MQLSWEGMELTHTQTQRERRYAMLQQSDLIVLVAVWIWPILTVGDFTQ